MTLKQARKQYLQGKISFQELDKIFFEKATKKEVDAFWSAPVFDRPLVVEGKSKSERDKYWIHLK